ncbi:MAG: hypothetical protein ACT4N5_01200 [Nitrosopumilaceae archaeon]
MGVHNNVHVPEESFPKFLWYAIEFFIVVGISVGIAMNSINYFVEIGFNEQMTNWIFWGIVGGVFLVYYMPIRTLVLKKPILKI